MNWLPIQKDFFRLMNAIQSWGPPTKLADGAISQDCMFYWCRCWIMIILNLRFILSASSFIHSSWLCLLLYLLLYWMSFIFAFCVTSKKHFSRFPSAQSELNIFVFRQHYKFRCFHRRTSNDENAEILHSKSHPNHERLLLKLPSVVWF